MHSMVVNKYYHSIDTISASKRGGYDREDCVLPSRTSQQLQSLTACIHDPRGNLAERGRHETHTGAQDCGRNKFADFKKNKSFSC